ncbi:CPXCG motif-containing cysteine-rich protein [Seonamhaeicola sp. MEBiC1930]|uniref:CPXCG motif-containing cysteine-rich protein n=1 Tax=Seonamhaeicola sp. MEBiC01930 TaxID=2976768 RepID=UPI00324DC595
MLEYYFCCPYCWQSISILLDLSIQEQNYIEDCEVCCNPIRIAFEVLESEITDFQASSIEQ